MDLQSRFVLGCLLLFVGCVKQKPASSEDANIYLLSREGFIQELVYAHATPRTSRFDDYTEGSYHLDKLDLYEGIRSGCGTSSTLLGLVQVGPFGPMWAYSVFLFLHEGSGVRMNHIFFQHARIWLKSTRWMPRVEFNQLWGRLVTSKALNSGIPTADALKNVPIGSGSLDWEYGVLLVDWSGPTQQIHFLASGWSDWSDAGPETSMFFEDLDALRANATWTYAPDLGPEEQSIYDPNALREP